MAITDKLAAVADAIRGKTGKAEKMTLDQMPVEIESIQTGGGDLKALVARTITELKDNQVTHVGNSALRNCTVLTSVDLPNVTSSDMYAFAGCTALASVNLPLIQTVHQYCFDHCTSLEEVVLPYAVNINNAGFQYCSKLKKIDTSVLRNLRLTSVSYCSALTMLILRNEEAVCILQDVELRGTPIAAGTGYIYVPRALLSDDDATKDYRRATNWSNFASQFRALEDYTVDGTVTGELDESKI